MDKIRFENYGTMLDGFPLYFNNIKRTPHNLTREQNWHENLEIQLCTSGEGMVLVDGKTHPIKKGDIVVVNSNALHYTFTDNFVAYSCLIISTKWCKQMNIPYDTIKFHPFVQDKKVASYIDCLANVQENSDCSLRLAKTNKILLEILIELIENYTSVEAFLQTNGAHFHIIKNTIAYIQKNFNQKITLDQIAKAVHYDKYALCREFKKYTGHTIVSHLNQYRSLQAIDYLTQGYTVAETAPLCGFDNLSFFTKTFKKYTGKNPSAFKNK